MKTIRQKFNLIVKRTYLVLVIVFSFIFYDCEKESAIANTTESNNATSELTEVFHRGNTKILVCYFDAKKQVSKVVRIKREHWKRYRRNGAVRLDDRDNDGYVPFNECGYGRMGDLDDKDPLVNPGAEEICDNGIDDDCDGHIDTNDPDCKACESAAVPDIRSQQTNILYVGVANFIEVSNPENKELQLTISGNGNTISSENDNRYKINVNELGSTTIEISIDGQIVKESSFDVLRVPSPAPILGNSSSSTISSSALKEQDELSLYFESDIQQRYRDLTCGISGFKVVLLRERGDKSEVVNIGAKFSLQTVQLLNTSRPGDFVVFTLVRTICSGDQVNRTLTPLVYEIK